MLYPPDLDDEGLGEYTLMPTHLHSFFTAEEMRGAVLASPAALHQGNAGPAIPALTTAARPPAGCAMLFRSFGTALYDIDADPRQERPIEAPEVAARLPARSRPNCAGTMRPPISSHG